jgi:lipopolysaccharide export LptBFGC system permease protein LptF
MRTMGLGLAVMAATTALLTAPPMSQLAARHANIGTLAVYLIPQALPLSMPIGLMFGILCGLRTQVSRQSRRLVLIAALACSLASLATLGWIMPAANQAFRVAASGKPTLARGLSELTLRELGQVIDSGTPELMLPVSPAHKRQIEWSYHMRWALGFAPLVLALFAVAVTSDGRPAMWRLGLAGCAGIAGYYTLMFGAERSALDQTLPMAVAAWLPNLAVALLSGAMMKASGRADALAAE